MLSERGAYGPCRRFALDLAAWLLAERDDLNKPQHSSTADGQRDTELTRVNGKLYAIAKVQSDKSCPLVAGAIFGCEVTFVTPSVPCSGRGNRRETL